MKKASITKNEIEHETRQLFCEMDELHSNLEWREAARWLKFEEDVELGGRWSKPHVATLQLHSLMELRNCLLNGVTLFDFPGQDLTSIVDMLVETFIRLKILNDAHKEDLRKTLLLKHVHQHDKEFQKSSDDKVESFPRVKSLAGLSKKSSSNVLRETCPSQSQLLKPEAQATIHKVETKSKINESLMKKIASNAEVSNVLVGEIDYIEHEFSAFVRLVKPVRLDDFTEVSLPTRFIFIILGPKDNIEKYREIGRSISTLMSDDIFQDYAYKAQNKHELINAFDNFLGQLTVIPPSEWDPNIRLNPPEKVPSKEERLKKINSAFAPATPHQTMEAHGSDPELKFSGRFCGGLVDDIKRKLPFYLSDYTDGLNLQCLSSILFMYFACLSPTITFGGLLGVATDQNMSAIESLLSGAICGILYALFAGQPLSIISSTGPVLIFETMINKFAKEYDIDYMGFRVWIGLWTAFFLVVVVVTDSSVLVKYITRFTEESFATLIAFIFIKESISKLLDIRHAYPFVNRINELAKQFTEPDEKCYRCLPRNSNASHMVKLPDNFSTFLNEEECAKLGSKNFEFSKQCQYVPEIFFVSVFLFIFTFTLACFFKYFRRSRFLPTFIRTNISDFGVVITIIFAVAVDYILGFDTPKLLVPLKFETTIPNRGWFINPLERNKGKALWLSILAIFPALFASILIFMDQHIPTVIVNRKENQLKKSSGYHLDLLIVAITIAINSFLGIPWFVAATILAINHVLTLRKYSEKSAPGEKPTFSGVHEQRVTSLVVYILIGLSVFLAKLLQRIPMPVLYGIFLYIGISSLSGNQFFNRLALFLMPEKHQPDYVYFRHVRTRRVHLFTIIQIACLVILLLINLNSITSICFPLMILALIGVRKAMECLFSRRELSYLDDVTPEDIKSTLEDDLKESQPRKEPINVGEELSKTQICDVIRIGGDKDPTNKMEMVALI